MPRHAASIHILTAIIIVMRVARLPLCEWNFRSGSTIATKRSPLSAVRVNTLTPMETSLKYSDRTHRSSPQGQLFKTYMTLVRGTVVTITSRSAIANERMYLQHARERGEEKEEIFIYSSQIIPATRQ